MALTGYHKALYIECCDWIQTFLVQYWLGVVSNMVFMQISKFQDPASLKYNNRYKHHILYNNLVLSKRFIIRNTYPLKSLSLTLSPSRLRNCSMAGLCPSLLNNSSSVV